ncbi:hypothetical protein RJ639_007706 [Escallonia herrerae]|uniref:Uncharacterized protein n=1 Tax=Escallonia herrerae TaxID=1293975 RepID=A0AA88VVB6_9ASTE|nr:hypothetical protein RJ639_007706 [Escallonia herrerae]
MIIFMLFFVSKSCTGHITIRIRSLFISTTINSFGFDNEFPPTFYHNDQPLWICSLRIDVEDLGTDKYNSVAEEIGRRVSSAAGTAAASPTATQTLGLVACGTGAGVSIFANKFPGIFAATCLSPGDALNTRSINNSNGVLKAVVGGVISGGGALRQHGFVVVIFVVKPSRGSRIPCYPAPQHKLGSEACLWKKWGLQVWSGYPGFMTWPRRMHCLKKHRAE